jgi:hypothetical protein
VKRALGYKARSRQIPFQRQAFESYAGKIIAVATQLVSDILW